MSRKVLTLVGLSICLALSNNAKAACVFEGAVPADGRLVGPFSVGATPLQFFSAIAAGRSYSVEVVVVGDNDSGLGLLVGGNIACPTVERAGTTDMTNADARLSSQGRRTSFTSTSADLFAFVVSMSSGTKNVMVSVSDTTQFNPRWSTFSGYTTQWGFHNTTNTTISGNLKVFTTAGSVVSNTTFDIPSGRVVFKTTAASGLNIAATLSGNAIFTHNGPPGGIQADAFLISSDGKIVVPAKFEPEREAAH